MKRLASQVRILAVAPYVFFGVAVSAKQYTLTCFLDSIYFSTIDDKPRYSCFFILIGMVEAKCSLAFAIPTMRTFAASISDEKKLETLSI